MLNSNRAYIDKHLSRMSIGIATNKLAATAMIYSLQSAYLFNFQLKLLHELKCAINLLTQCEDSRNDYPLNDCCCDGHLNP